MPLWLWIVIGTVVAIVLLVLALGSVLRHVAGKLD
jgi:hypothetical protein